MRKYPDRPVVGVGAVVLEAGRVLLVRRAHEPLKGEWSLPGGAVEVGETLVDAAAREVLEETGLAVRVGPIVEVLDRVHRDLDGRVEYHYVLIDYLCTPLGGMLRASSDAADARWALASELPRFELQATTLNVIRKAFDMAGSGA